MRVETCAHGGTRAGAKLALIALLLVPVLAGCGDGYDRTWLPYFELAVPDAEEGRVTGETVRVEGRAVAADGLGAVTWSLNGGPASSTFDALDRSTGAFSVVVGPLDVGANDVEFRMEDRTGRTARELLSIWREDGSF